MNLSQLTMPSRVAINIVIDIVIFVFIFLLMVFNQVVYGSFMSYLAMRISHKNRINSSTWEEETEETKSHLFFVLIVCVLLNNNISLTHTELCLNVVAMIGLYFLLIWNGYVYLYVMKKTNKNGTIGFDVKYLKPVLNYFCVLVYDFVAPPMERDYWHYLACFVLFLDFHFRPLVYLLGAVDLSGKRSMLHWVLYWIFTFSVIIIEYCVK